MLSPAQCLTSSCRSSRRPNQRNRSGVSAVCSSSPDLKTAGVKAAVAASAVGAGVLLLPGPASAGAKQTVAVQAASVPPAIKADLSPVLVISLVVSQAVGLIGATVTGIRARKKGVELKTTIEKLRMVNITLRDAQKETRRQMRRARQAERVAHTTPLPAETEAPTPAEGEETPENVELRPLLTAARSELTNGSAQTAYKLFQDIELKAQLANDMQSARKAVRGCAAAKQRLGDFKGAIEALKQSLRLGELLGVSEGDKETVGRIADLYAEIGDFDNAGVYYDKYLACEGSDRGL